MKYRAEIDGLRAIAVIPVILFHAGYDVFGGGYIGVDIFFVISGYLITSIIINQISNDKFSLITFYERRARRILPALSFTIFLTVAISPFVLMPDQIKDLGQSIFSISLFISNYFFYIETDYFNEFSSMNPLLHTWSLAVEEQFYLLFPIFILLFRRNIIHLVIFCFFIFAISLYASVILSSENPALSFYSSHTRAWELIVGALASLLFLYKGNNLKSFFWNHPILANLLTVLSLFLILLSFIFFNEDIDHPGFITLVPVLSTASLILIMGHNDYVTRFLKNRIIVYIGLLSYSLYLIHNPIFSYIEIYYEFLSDDALTTIKTLSLPLIFLISFISYK